MEPNELLEMLRDFILKNRLPLNDIALFGVLCPLCGKTDRIRELESPDELSAHFGLDEPGFITYSQCFEQIVKGPYKLGVCKFCNTPLLLDMGAMKATWLIQA